MKEIMLNRNDLELISKVLKEVKSSNCLVFILIGRDYYFYEIHEFEITSAILIDVYFDTIKFTTVNHLKEIIDSAKKEVIICMHAEEMILKEKLFADTFNLLKKKGIDVKIALFGEAEIIEQLSKSLKIKIKKVNIEGKFFIIDRNEVLFYLSKESTKDDNAIWLNSAFFSEAFAGLFDLALQ